MEKEEIIWGLQEVAEWIAEVADHDFEEWHKYMCDAIDEAIEILRREP